DGTRNRKTHAAKPIVPIIGARHSAATHHAPKSQRSPRRPASRPTSNPRTGKAIPAKNSIVVDRSTNRPCRWVNVVGRSAGPPDDVSTLATFQVSARVGSGRGSKRTHVVA